MQYATKQCKGATRRGRPQVARDVGGYYRRRVATGATEARDECGLSQAGSATALDRGAKTRLPALAVGSAI
ncbi:hypothetical protein HBI80_220980 [Parastagonospora nodorum]|nr:hypothetical protein HBI80_220980 [Parastagonospora nodorum]KAH4954144.1 hypothetical protein HBI78_231060 [Parastagonospora nodorum]KAH6285813.1 hypothetical protein HBI39_236820 [Parastagonospora nodorum]